MHAYYSSWQDSSLLILRTCLDAGRTSKHVQETSQCTKNFCMSPYFQCYQPKANPISVILMYTLLPTFLTTLVPLSGSINLQQQTHQLNRCVNEEAIKSYAKRQSYMRIQPVNQLKSPIFQASFFEFNLIHISICYSCTHLTRQFDLSLLGFR